MGRQSKGWFKGWGLLLYVLSGDGDRHPTCIIQRGGHVDVGSFAVAVFCFILFFHPEFPSTVYEEPEKRLRRDVVDACTCA